MNTWAVVQTLKVKAAFAAKAYTLTAGRYALPIPSTHPPAEDIIQRCYFFIHGTITDNLLDKGAPMPDDWSDFPASKGA